MAEQVTDEQECRELDAWLAEHLLGWTDRDSAYQSRQWKLDASSGAPVGRLSTTGDGMVAVMEALRAGGWSVEVSWIEDGEPWYAAFTSPAGVFQCDAPTAPLAVARAARAALEASDD